MLHHVTSHRWEDIHGRGTETNRGRGLDGESELRRRKKKKEGGGAPNVQRENVHRDRRVQDIEK